MLSMLPSAADQCLHICAHSVLYPISGAGSGAHYLSPESLKHALSFTTAVGTQLLRLWSGIDFVSIK
jgi:hypothetical protein